MVVRPIVVLVSCILFRWCLFLSGCFSLCCVWRCVVLLLRLPCFFWCDSLGTGGYCTIKKQYKRKPEDSFFLCNKKAIFTLMFGCTRSSVPLLFDCFTLFVSSSVLMLIVLLPVVVLVLYAILRRFLSVSGSLFPVLSFDALLLCCCVCLVFLMWSLGCCWLLDNWKQLKNARGNIAFYCTIKSNIPIVVYWTIEQLSSFFIVQ